jgi:hypothetical protein
MNELTAHKRTPTTISVITREMSVICFLGEGTRNGPLGGGPGRNGGTFDYR